MSEHLEQCAVVYYCQLKRLAYFSIPNGQMLHGNERQRAGQIRKLKAEGFLDGASDLVVMLPKTILFIEMKKQKKKLNNGTFSNSHSKPSDNQLAFLKMVNRFGYAFGKVCYGSKEAIAFIESEL